jgi:hypothetical protein
MPKDDIPHWKVQMHKTEIGFNLCWVRHWKCHILIKLYLVHLNTYAVIMGLTGIGKLKI